MLASKTRASRAATCEEWDEDAQTILPDTRTSANVAAKRSKPELVPTESDRPRFSEGDDGKMSGRHKDTQNDPPTRKGKKSSGLKLNTLFPERESRPYSSGPPRKQPAQSAGRPAAQRSISRAEKPEPMMRHPPGQCRSCDSYGYHILEPSEAQAHPKEKSIPQSPLVTSQQASQQAPPATQRPEASRNQSRPTRRQSSHEQRPTSYHAGMSYSAFPVQAFPASDWNMLPTTPFSAYPQTPYAQTPTLPFLNPFELYSQSMPLQYSQQAPPPSGPRPQEPRRRTSTRAEPIIQQSPILADKPHLGRTRSHRETQRSQDPSMSRQEDARKRMPPPQIIPAARRPNIIKANTTIYTPTSYQKEQGIRNGGSASAPLPYIDPKPDRPPSSYRKPPPSSYHYPSEERPVTLKSKSYTEPKQITKVNSSQPGLDRRNSYLGAEFNEMKAEAYQKSRGTDPQPLTLDAISKIARRSDGGSQRSVNTSSKGSSASKNRAAEASNDITLKMHGVTLDISADSAEKHSIKIQPKRNGGISISVDQQESSGKDNKAMSLRKRSGSTTSSSKQSRWSSEKEVRRSRDQSSDREPKRAPNVSNRSSQVFYDDSPGYGLAYG